MTILVDVVTEHERTGRQLDDACSFRTDPYLTVPDHQTVDEVARHGNTIGGSVPMTEGAVLLIQNTHSSKRTHQQTPFRRGGQRSSIVVRQRMCIGSMMIFGHGTRIGIIGKQAYVGRNPHGTATFQHIGNVSTLQTLHHGCYIPEHQLTVLFYQTVQSVLHIDPYRTVMVDINQTHLRGITTVTAFTDMIHAAVLLEGIAENSIACKVPQTALRITIHLHRRTFQQFTDITFPKFRYRTAHGSHIHHGGLLVIGHPQPLVPIFGKALTGIARTACMAFQYGHGERITVIAHGSTSIGGYPYKTLTISKYLVYMQMGQTR